MMQHCLNENDRLTKLAELRRFLVRRVHPGISLAARFQAEKSLSSASGKPVTLKEGEAFALLSQTLRRRIHVELCYKHLKHPLFRWWSAMDADGVQAACHTAIEFVGLAPEDNLFFPRNTAVGAYILTAGTAAYTEYIERHSQPAVEV